jgi:hypothetical protein
MKFKKSIKTRGFPSSDFSDFGFFMDDKNNDQLISICKNHANSDIYIAKPYMVGINIKYGVKIAVSIHRKNYVIVG